MSYRRTLIVDIDGTIADLTGALGYFIAGKTGRHLSEFTPPRNYDFAEQWGLSLDEFYAFFGEFGERGYIAKCELYDGVVDALTKLRGNGLRVIIATARGTDSRSSETFRWRVKTDTIDWLHRRHVPYDGLHFTSDKQLLGANYIIEDASFALEAARQAGLTAIAFDQDYNKDWQYSRVAHWNEVPDLLHAIRAKESKYDGK